jgi:hypothetical protein
MVQGSEVAWKKLEGAKRRTKAIRATRQVSSPTFLRIF